MKTQPVKVFVCIAIIAFICIVGSVMVAKCAGIEYRNDRYGFSVSLPRSWRVYSVVTDTWEGYASDTQGRVVSEQGTEIGIRHPQWTSQHPRQDIPVMIFTLAQWAALQQGKFSVSAAPIEPTELGHNGAYVFALPARYNYAYATGWEEVAKILEGTSFHAF